MKTIGQYIKDVQTAYDKGIASDDSRLSARFTYSMLLTARNRLINQQSNKNQKVGQWAFQTLNCVELETAPIHECPCLPPKGCTVYRTKHIIPQPLVGMDNHLIQSVSSVTGDIIFSETNWEEKKYASGRRYAKKVNDYYLRNGRIYITRQTGPSMIEITGLWQDPLLAYAYPSSCNNCETGECEDCESPLDKEFPFDTHQENVLVEMTTQMILKYFAQATEDRTNNTADSPEEQSK